MTSIPGGNLRTLVALTFLLVVPTIHASASVIYEFRETGSSTPIAFLEFASPPASSTTGWTTSDPADLLSFTCDCLYPLHYLPAGSTVTLSVASFDGIRLDSGFIDAVYTALPFDPADGPIEGSVSVTFDSLLHGDVLAVATRQTLADGTIVFTDFFPTNGDFRLVPEPATLTLLGIGLLAVGRRIRHAGRCISRRASRPVGRAVS